MDNVQGQGTPAAPAPGQATAQSQTPTESASGNTAAVIESGAARADGQSNAGQEGLILGKFKSQQDLEKAYQELETHNKKVEMDRAELEKLFVQPESSSTPEPQAPAAVMDDDPLKPVADALTPKLTQEVNRLISPVIARMEVDNMVRRYGDSFVSVAKDVKDIQLRNPHLSLEDAYKLVSFDRLQRTSNEQRQQRQTEAAHQAQKAQVETAQPSGQREVSLRDAVKSKEVSTKELFQALGPEYEAWTQNLK